MRPIGRMTGNREVVPGQKSAWGKCDSPEEWRHAELEVAVIPCRHLDHTAKALEYVWRSHALARPSEHANGKGKKGNDDLSRRLVRMETSK